MSYEIIALGQFKKDVKRLIKRYKNIKSDLLKLSDELRSNPMGGIHLGLGLYKIRVANSSIPTGKSGGFRVIYYLLDERGAIYLLTIYSKSEIESIDDAKLLEIFKKSTI